MNVFDTPLQDVFVIEPEVHGDSRGYFFEAFRDEDFSKAGLPTRYRQENQSRSTKNVLRGLHYQRIFPQGKLVRVSNGSVFDVAVDLRKDSATFGQSYGVELSEENFKMMYIPEGFAHGYCVLSESAIFQYKTTDIYHPEDEYGILWNDPALNLNWPVKNPVVSEKDRNLPVLKDINENLLF